MKGAGSKFPAVPSLRRNDAAEGVAARKDDAAVVHFRRLALRRSVLGNAGAFDEGSAAGRAPVGLGAGGENGVALRAEEFHGSILQRTVSYPLMPTLPPRFPVH